MQCLLYEFYYFYTTFTTKAQGMCAGAYKQFRDLKNPTAPHSFEIPGHYRVSYQTLHMTRTIRDGRLCFLNFSFWRETSVQSVGLHPRRFVIKIILYVHLSVLDFYSSVSSIVYASGDQPEKYMKASQTKPI